MNLQQRPERPVLAERLYALWLGLYPQAHRQDYGPLMLQTFRDSYRDARSTPGHGGLRFWLGVLGDEVKSLAWEHAAALRAQDPPPPTGRFALASGLLLGGDVLVYLLKCVH
jgi:hypothetical protein